ncbi:MAG: DUF6644 family protein [Bryobacteraceae bacterium]
MYAFLSWLQTSFLGHAMRESGVWTYGVVNLLHILSVATLFGSILILDLRLLGVWKKIDLVSLTTPIVPVSGAGFLIATLTGVGLLATKATEYDGNPFFYIKFPAIALGLVNVAILTRTEAWQQHRVRKLTPGEEAKFARCGGVSLLCWLAAITAGRMIGYW